MKTINRSIGMVALVATMILAVSCKDNKKEHDNSDGHHSEMNADDNQSKMNHDNNNNDGHHDGESKEMAMNGNGASQVILNDYFNLKDALVSDDNAKAKELGATLAKSFGNLNVSKYPTPSAISFLKSDLNFSHSSSVMANLSSNVPPTDF